MIKQLLIVGIGGGAGSILRFAASLLTARYYSGSFPIATFAVNVSGCFLIGLIAGLAAGYFPQNANLRLLLITGFCGGYTTFSTFAFENLNLLQYHNIWTAAIYIITSVLLGIGAVWLGLTAGTYLIK